MVKQQLDEFCVGDFYQETELPENGIYIDDEFTIKSLINKNRLETDYELLYLGCGFIFGACLDNPYEYECLGFDRVCSN